MSHETSKMDFIMPAFLGNGTMDTPTRYTGSLHFPPPNRANRPANLRSPTGSGSSAVNSPQSPTGGAASLQGQDPVVYFWSTPAMGPFQPKDAIIPETGE